MDQVNRDILWEEYLIKAKSLEDEIDGLSPPSTKQHRIDDGGGDCLDNVVAGPGSIKSGSSSKPVIIGPDNNNKLDKASLEDKFNQFNTSLDELKRLFTEMKIFLPAYNLRKAQETLNNLKDKIEAKRKILLPRKKFAFKIQPMPLKVMATSANPDDPSSPETRDLILGSFFGFKDINDGSLTIERHESSGKDIQLINLSNCKVAIKGRPCSVSVFKCVNCEIAIGPVDSSVFINNCQECSFFIMCHQLRIHESYNCQFSVHLTSRGIIEDSSGLVFTPYSWTYPGFEEDLQLTTLDLSNNNWDKIDDFNWLVKDKPSPNWTRMNITS